MVKHNDSAEAIKERLRITNVTIVTIAGLTANAWSSIPECKTRYVVAIILVGDDTVSRTVGISTVDDAGTVTVVFDDVPIEPDNTESFPEGDFDVMSPLLSVEGGGNLRFQADGGAPTATVIWYDEP